MKPLIDGDVLLHEIGWSCEFHDKEKDEDVFFNAEFACNLLDEKINLICEEAEADEPPILFLSDNEQLARQEKRKFIPNFRYEVAKTQPYKGNRVNPKPFHFYNLLAYMRGMYETHISDDGLEADDEMAIYQCANEGTIICSRDKDLRITPGSHYTWECGKQRAIGPVTTDRIGWLEMELVEKGTKKNGEPKYEKKVIGYGLSFFYYQMLVGDSADYIPGLKGWGPVAAYDLLHELNTEEELSNAVKTAYKEVMGSESKDYFLEQANLLWIRQEKGKGFEIYRPK